jgi:hypothetical protein
MVDKVEKGACDNIRDCVETIKVGIEELCKEKRETSSQLEEVAEKLKGVEQFLPPTTPPTVKKIVTGAQSKVSEIAQTIQGAGGLTTNFSKQAGKAVSALGTMNLKRGQYQTGLGGSSVLASSAEISPNAPVGGTWVEKMSQSKKKPYWVSSELNSRGNPKTSWVKPVKATISGGRKRTRRAKKSKKSKSRKSRR